MRLAGKKKLLVLVALVAVAAMCAFPPWLYTVKTAAVYNEWPAGYHFIGTPPPRDGTTQMHGVRLDTVRLLFQLLGLAALAGITWIVMGDPEEAAYRPDRTDRIG